MAAKPKSEPKSTRVCVKNLPPSFTETSLRSHLTTSNQNVVITDCKLLKTKDGKSRKLAFVGLKTPEMAQHVISYFDKTYALTSRLSVEKAFSKKTEQPSGEHRPWSKYSVGSSRHDKSAGVSKTSQLLLDRGKKVSEKEKKQLTAVEKKKEEFIEAMMGGGKEGGSKTFWSNDDGLVGIQTSTSDNPHSNSDDSSYSSDSKSSSTLANQTGKLEKKGAAPGNAVISDMDFLRSKIITSKNVLSDHDSDQEGLSEKDDNSDTDSSDNDDEKTKAINQTEVKDSINDSKKEYTERLFVRNLPFGAMEDDVREVFTEFGTVVECHVPIDDTKRNKGYAFVKFASIDDAGKAMESLDGVSFQGRLMHILPAAQERGGTHERDQNDLTYKGKMEMERKTDISTGLSTSFIRGDAVVDNLSDRLNLGKGDILSVKDNLSSGNAAVRLALGETHILEENRKFLLKHGVHMDTIVSIKSKTKGMKADSSNCLKRSLTMILVKNLPFDTKTEELLKIFANQRVTPNVILAPSRTIALVQYEHSNEAKMALRKMLYKRFKHVPLYLEMAPLSGQQTVSDDVTDKGSIGNEDDLQEEDEHVTVDETSTTIYVKNLNFQTSEENLHKLFDNLLGKIRTVRIPTKSLPIKRIKGTQIPKQEPTARQSMGFGFVECFSSTDAQKGITRLQGKVIDGHALELKISAKETSSTVVKSSDKRQTKMMVRNVPFQASRAELLRLFGAFGQLKTVRLPKKFNGGHRGFAFIEFIAGEEAHNAMNALSQTHLYGRHLVLEWADDNDDIDLLRSKAKRDALAEDKPKNKRIRFD